MKHTNIIDCYKLELIKDIPRELTETISHKNHLLVQNQRLKNIIWSLGISVSCLLLLNLFQHYSKKQQVHPKKSVSDH